MFFFFKSLDDLLVLIFTSLNSEYTDDQATNFIIKQEPKSEQLIWAYTTNGLDKWGRRNLDTWHFSSDMEKEKR